MATNRVARTIFFAFLAMAAAGTAIAQENELPEVLKPWEPWVLWDEQQRDCPQPFNNADRRYCAWPSQLSLSAGEESGSWSASVTVFAETWVALPGREEVWPLKVRANDKPVSVVAQNGQPSVRLPKGKYKLEGEFQWSKMPQRIAIPSQFGVLALEVEGKQVPMPAWGSDGLVWLKRQRAEEATKDLLAAQVYRVIEDGIPMWLRTDIELTVSGRSREEMLGSVLPQGWRLATVESPLPVAVDGEGKMKAQVRAGKWTVSLHAFRTQDLGVFSYADDADAVVASELIAFRSKPDFRIADLEGIPAVDVNQTTFPGKWRSLPVYAWNTSDSFQLNEKMRGMGLGRPAGLSISRRLWLDDDGAGFTYRDSLRGKSQQIWRLDVAAGQDLGAVRIDGRGQLITANPKTGAHGVEIRNRNLNLDAVGRIEQVEDLTATGWQSSADSLSMSFSLPPGWRLLALFGADRVRGDWLTAWTLLDLFLTLIFALAVYRIWGFKAGLIALLAFGLSYHEPYSPRLTWFFLLLPLALLPLVTASAGSWLLKAWRNLALALLIVHLVPFVARQVQSAIYPQLESAGRSYGDRDVYPRLLHPTRESAVMNQAAYDADPFAANQPAAGEFGAGYGGALGGYEYGRLRDERQQKAASRGGAASAGTQQIQENLQLDPESRVQTGPAEPEWDWNRVSCSWNGPVAAGQQIKPIFMSSMQRRILTVIRVLLLLLLLGILLGVRIPILSTANRSAAILFALTLCCNAIPAQAQFPDAEMLNTLRSRLLAAPDAFPHAADIPSASLTLDGNRLTMTAEIHAAAEVAVPLPGRFPSWSPLSVRLENQQEPLVRRDEGYLWIVVPQGVHQVTVEGMLPDTTEWEWTFQLKPRYLTIRAPNWNVAGISPDGVPEGQVFFSRQQELESDQAAYDQKQFDVVVHVSRQIETGLVWKVHNRVTRLSAAGKAVSLKLPLLEGESVLTSKASVENGVIDVRLGANQRQFQWESELAVKSEIRLQAPESDRWVESWELVSSPVWNVDRSGLTPIFEATQQMLIPTWNPWPGESAALAFSKPEAVQGETITIRRVQHESEVGSRQRTMRLRLGVECSMAEDLQIAIDPQAEVTQLRIGKQRIPVRRVDDKLVVPTRPGQQTIDVEWILTTPLLATAELGRVVLPMEAANVTSILHVPQNRWVLWAQGPRMGPAVRFWTILVCALLLAVGLGSIPNSPLKKYEWILLALGLTQVHLIAAMIVVGWLFLLVWRGRLRIEALGRWRFNLLQVGIVMLTFVVLGILLAVVGEGLLGNPDMFVSGNGSSRTFLQWFQPRSGTELPNPYFVSISVWYYRLLMLLWALWLAVALLRWLKWGWQQFTHGEGWRHPSKQSSPAAEVAS